MRLSGFSSKRGYLGRLIPEEYCELKAAVAKRLEAFHALPKDKSRYGLVHFDYSDGNWHIDMDTFKR